MPFKMTLAVAVGAVALFVAAACGDDSDGGTTQLKQPDSQTPAAGICAEPPAGDVATITINVDAPSPRCSKITPEQRLRVVNNTAEPVQVELARFRVTVAPAEAQVLDAPAGDYLAPGVHVLQVSSTAGGAEVWLTSQAQP
jgi:hypothetical protein